MIKNGLNRKVSGNDTVVSDNEHLKGPPWSLNSVFKKWKRVNMISCYRSNRVHLYAKGCEITYMTRIRRMVKPDCYTQVAETDPLVFAKLIPVDHDLRQVKGAIDFEPMREKVKACYSLNMGRCFSN